MSGVRIPYNALVLVGDGTKALFLRNKGDGQHPNLVLERLIEQESLPTREQGTDRPGRSNAGGSAPLSAFAETDWHRLDEERFAREIAQALYAAAHANRFDKLVVVAPPRTLGELRKEFHKEVSDRIVAEVDKTLTNRDLGDIERILAKA